MLNYSVFFIVFKYIKVGSYIVRKGFVKFTGGVLSRFFFLELFL